LASERLAGTPPHLCEGEVERRSREYPPRGEAGSTRREKKPRAASVRRN